MQKVLVRVGATCARCCPERVSTGSRMRLRTRICTTCNSYLYVFAIIFRYVYSNCKYKSGITPRLVILVARCVPRARSLLVLTPAPYAPAFPVSVSHRRLSCSERWGTPGFDSPGLSCTGRYAQPSPLLLLCYRSSSVAFPSLFLAAGDGDPIVYGTPRLHVRVMPLRIRRRATPLTLCVTVLRCHRILSSRALTDHRPLVLPSPQLSWLFRPQTRPPVLALLNRHTIHESPVIFGQAWLP